MTYKIPKEVVDNLNEEEWETLFNALIYARDMNGVECDGDFDAVVLDNLIEKLFPKKTD